MTIGIAKVRVDGNNVSFQATHLVVEALGRSLLTGWLIGKRKSTGFRNF